ncbi:MAG: LytTR family transcriptional regulator DNA-binding domain-containing protein [Saprospiraceae bacterium]
MIYSLVILDADLRTRAVCEQVLKAKPLSKIHLAGLATEINCGKKLLAKTKPDILILGDNLPNDTFLSLLNDEQFKVPSVLIVAASDTEHSFAALKKGALDYLLKPLSNGHLEAALLRGLEKLMKQPRIDDKLPLLSIDQRLLVKNTNGTFFISRSSIIRCQSEEGYTTIFCHGKHPTLVLSKTLKSVEEKLKEDRFVRVHQSHLINLDAIVDVEADQTSMVLEMVDGARIPVSHRRRSLLLSKLPSI